MAQASKISLDVEVDKMKRALNLIDKELAPAIMAETLNTAADAIGNRARRNAEKRLTIRRSAGLKQVKQDRHARGPDIDRMYSRAIVGLSYLGNIEMGERVTPEQGGRVPIPTVAARTSQNQSRSIAKRFKLNQVGNIGDGGSEGNWDKTFFVGSPKGGNRPPGMYFRHGKNNRLKMVRLLTQQSVNVEGRGFFQDAARQFGTPQYINAKFLEIANRELSRLSQGK